MMMSSDWPTLVCVARGGGEQEVYKRPREPCARNGLCPRLRKTTFCSANELNHSVFEATECCHVEVWILAVRVGYTYVHGELWDVHTPVHFQKLEPAYGDPYGRRRIFSLSYYPSQGYQHISTCI